jgi:hypothetical protein
MVGVKGGQGRNGDDFAPGAAIPKKGRLIMGSFRWLRRCGKRLQRGRSRRRSGRSRYIGPDRKGPGHVPVETPSAMDAPLLGLLVLSAAMRALHNPAGFLDAWRPFSS